jgi:hypothetical protein
MNLSTLLDKVFPEGAILQKSSGLWDYYLNEEHFKEGKDFLNKRVAESFNGFVDRIIESHIESEVDQEEKLVTIDYTIYKDKEESQNDEEVLNLITSKLNERGLDTSAFWTTLPFGHKLEDLADWLVSRVQPIQHPEVKVIESIVFELSKRGVKIESFDVHEGIPATPEQKLAIWISKLLDPMGMK